MIARRARKITRKAIAIREAAEHEAYLHELEVQRLVAKRCVENDVPIYLEQCLTKITGAAEEGLFETSWWVRGVCFPNEAVNVLIRGLKSRGYRVIRNVTNEVTLTISWEE